MAAECQVSRALAFGTVSVPDTASYSFDGLDQRSIDSIAASGTVTINLGIDVSAAKVILLKASGNCTVKTNDAGSPDDTVALTARPYLWTHDGYFVNLLTADVTSLIVTAGSASITFFAGVMQDTTP